MSRGVGATAAVLALLLAATPVVAVTTPGAVTGDAAVTPEAGAAVDPGVGPSGGGSPQILPENESTAPHENPDEAAERGNLTVVRRWLVRRAGTVLVRCARRGTVEEPTNGTCQPITDGETYPALVSQAELVAAATATQNDDGLPAALRRAGDRQVRFVRAVVTYRSTVAAYREARAQNRSRRALALARRVSVLSARVDAVGGNLTDDYGQIERNGPASLGPARQIVSNTTQNVTGTADQIGSTEFTVPRLTLSTNRTNVSFTRPTTITGQLRSREGDPLPDRAVVVGTPEGEVRRVTDENGTFEAHYRPTNASVGNATVSAAYRPAVDSVRRATSTERVVSVQPTTATLRLTDTTSTVGFGEPLRVNGTVRVDGTPVPDLPLVIALDGREFAATTTNETGQFNATPLIPPGVPPRNLTLTVRSATGDRALTTDSASATVRVRQTEPRLVVGSERLDADTVRLFGGLSAGGVGVPEARLQFRHEGESVGVVRTSETGQFEANVTVDGVPADSPTAMTVVYAPAGGNLEPLELGVRVRPVPQGLPDASGLRETVTSLLAPFLRLDPTLLAGGALAALTVFLVATTVAYRGRGAGLRSLWPFGDADDGDDPAVAGDADDAEADAPRPSLLDTARGRLDDGRPDEAVVVAYGAVRDHLDRTTAGADPSLTHWELLVVARGALDGERRAALERLTATYESAAFSPGRNTVERAREALDSAAVVVGNAAAVAGDPDDSGDA